MNQSESKSDIDQDLLTAGVLKRHEIENFTVNESEIHKHCIPLTWSNCDATPQNSDSFVLYLPRVVHPSIYTILYVKIFYL